MRPLAFSGHFSLKAENTDPEIPRSAVRRAEQLLKELPPDAMISLHHPNGSEVICEDCYDGPVEGMLQWAFEPAIAEQERLGNPGLAVIQNAAPAIDRPLIQTLLAAFQTPTVLQTLLHDHPTFLAFSQEIGRRIANTREALNQAGITAKDY